MNIRLTDITKKYNDKIVLQDFSCEIAPGEVIWLMGSSGVGKTTLLRILAGLEQADQGSITGVPRRIGMVFQEDRLCEEYTVSENLNLVLKRKMPEPELTGHLRSLGLEDVLHRPVRDLSGGMKRRVAVLRAMLADNELLLMDEPFSGLDETNRMRTLEYIKCQRKGRTLVLVTHNEEDGKVLQGRQILLEETC